MLLWTTRQLEQQYKASMMSTGIHLLQYLKIASKTKIEKTDENCRIKYLNHAKALKSY